MNALSKLVLFRNRFLIGGDKHETTEKRATAY